jgi:hypothetical protein
VVSEAVRVEGDAKVPEIELRDLAGFCDAAHDGSGMSEETGLDVPSQGADDPIPVAYRFDGDRRAGFTLEKQLPYCTGMMFYACLEPYLSVKVLNRCKVVPLVEIQ